MSDNRKIRKAYDYLVKKAGRGTSISAQSLARASGWALSTANIYLSKKFRELVRKQEERFYVRPDIERVRIKEFMDLFPQKRQLFTEYILERIPNVLVYEFFMPLTREERLREALDNLFYRDSIEKQIREIGYDDVRTKLELHKKIAQPEIVDKVCALVQQAIGGYSLSIVSGRFRANNLLTREQASHRPPGNDPYLVEETTAVVRFILPVDPPGFSWSDIPATRAEQTQKIADQISWLFFKLFAEAICKVVREDEIWLLESGLRSGLYRWVKKLKSK